MATRVLSFMAHPDDCEFTCAGTLIRLKQEAGCEIAIATSTSGDCGSAELRPEEIARVRHEEAKAAARLLDAEYYAAGCVDLLVMYDKPTLMRFVEIVRRATPAVVITHPPADYMMDHENVSRLVRMACFSAGCRNLATYDQDPAPPLEKVPHLYYADPVELKHPCGKPAAPAFVVDITAAIGTKEKMLACHASQREWLRKHHGMDEYIEMMKRMGAERGKMIERPFGEGFRQHLGHPHPQNNAIAELLKMTS
jgi:LmbE family N-acetylglucosaminyl deacetylase